MLSFVLRRIFLMIPTLIGITLLTFLLFNVVGRNPALLYAGKRATAEQIQKIEKELGIDRPIARQYLFYLKQIVTFDFGHSWSTKQKISTMITDGLGASLSLAVPAFLMTLILSITIALAAAYSAGSIFDRTVLVTCLAGMSLSVLVYIIFFQFFFGYKLGWFPISGYDPSLSGRWRYLSLGWMIWIVVSLGSQVLFFRSILVEEMTKDYVRTAKAKGIGPFQIYFKHVLKNAMIPVITLVVLEIPFLYTGSLFIESFFGIPGLGGVLIQALGNSDFPVIKAMTFIGALLYVVFNLISDLCYAWADPRIQLK